MRAAGDANVSCIAPAGAAARVTENDSVLCESGDPPTAPLLNGIVRSQDANLHLFARSRRDSLLDCQNHRGAHDEPQYRNSGRTAAGEHPRQGLKSRAISRLLMNAGELDASAHRTANDPLITSTRRHLFTELLAAMQLLKFL